MIKAVILAGGLGTRLRPLTDDIPKSMIAFKGLPFLHYVISDLYHGGIRDFVLACSYKWQRVRGFFQSGMVYKSRIAYSIEDRPRGSANALRIAYNKLNNSAPCLIANGDTLIQGLNAEKLLLAFGKSGKDICRVNAVNALNSEKMEYAGVAALSPRVLREIIASDHNSLEKDYFPKFDILDYNLNGMFFDIGTKEGLELTKRYLNGEKIEAGQEAEKTESEKQEKKKIRDKKK